MNHTFVFESKFVKSQQNYKSPECTIGQVFLSFTRGALTRTP